MMGKIVLFQRIIPHYRLGTFNHLLNDIKELEIVYGNPANNETLKNAKIPANDRYLFTKNYYLYKEQIFISNIFAIIRNKKPKIVISVFNIGNINILFLFLIRRILNFKIILWSFGYDPTRGFDPEHMLKDKLRLFFYQKADGVIFYWQKGLEEVLKYSQKKHHYFVAPNSVDTSVLIQFKNEYNKIGKDILKKELKIAEKYHFIFVGRLIPDKEVILLLKAFLILNNNISDTRLTIIGDGPEKNALEKFVIDNSIKNVIFLGEMLDQAVVSKWIYISDAFVLPGRLGNSVVQSFSLGTPIISQRKDSFFHGEGIGYLHEGVNGLLCNDGDHLDLNLKMKSIIESQEYSDDLRINAFNTVINECSIEKFIEGFNKAIHYVSVN